MRRPPASLRVRRRLRSRVCRSCRTRSRVRRVLASRRTPPIAVPRVRRSCRSRTRVRQLLESRGVRSRSDGRPAS
ncbi:hypothetical protein C5C71_14655 [Rathayibacter sp. AY1C1]|nr:hypothetical protein C5C71_14655 [Rathayibacter sp. AY1C1]